MNLLGNESEVSSHQFVFLHVWPAVAYQSSIFCSTDCNGDNADVEVNEEGWNFDSSSDEMGTEFNNESSNRTGQICTNFQDHADKMSTGSEAENDSTTDDMAIGPKNLKDCEPEPENHEFESEFTEVKNRTGRKYTLYVDHLGQAHAISQHEIYRHRVANWDVDYRDPGCTDPETARRYRRSKEWKAQAWYEQRCGLKEYSLLQFAMNVTVKRFPPSGTIKDDNTKAFLLNKKCPLHKSHYLHLNSKEKIPILAGITRPCPPQGEEPKDVQRRKRWKTRANRFARYMGAILFPWDRNGDCGVHNWNQLQQKVISMKHSRLKNSHRPDKVYCDTFHLQYLNNVASNMRTTELIKKTTHAWGSEFAQRFSKESVRKFSERSQDRSKVVTSAEELQELLNRATAEQAIVATSTDAAKASTFIEDMNKEMNTLYEECDNIDKVKDLTECAKNRRKEISNWDDLSGRYDKTWADKQRTILKKNDQTSEPIVTHPLGTRRSLNRTANGKLELIRRDLEVNEDWIRVFDHVKETWLRGQQLLLFIHGGPGTGKTTLANAIMEMATVFNFETRFSATSGVAGLLNNGTTIHHLLGQQGELTATQPNVNKIRLRNGNARVILVDEVSVET